MSTFFQRTWDEFKEGFGQNVEFDDRYWIGLDRLHDLSQRGCAVRFDVQYADDGTWHHAQYSTFHVGDSADNYRLNIAGYSGDISDSIFQFHNNAEFSTYDNGPQQACTDTYQAGWWYNDCCAACLTSFNYFQVVDIDADTIYPLYAAEVRFVCWWLDNQ